MITQALKDAWLAELRDPNNKQHFDTFFPEGSCQYPSVLKGRTCFCAMGALVKATAILAKTETIYPFQECDKLVSTGEFKSITNMNDNDGKSFVEIADWIEANVPVEG